MHQQQLPLLQPRHQARQIESNTLIAPRSLPLENEQPSVPLSLSIHHSKKFIIIIGIVAVVVIIIVIIIAIVASRWAEQSLVCWFFPLYTISIYVPNQSIVIHPQCLYCFGLIFYAIRSFREISTDTHLDCCAFCNHVCYLFFEWLCDQVVSSSSSLICLSITSERSFSVVIRCLFICCVHWTSSSIDFNQQ